jgi:NAD-dependent SIR2 family protein deacetylase
MSPRTRRTDPSGLEDSVEQLAALVASARHCIFCTGAGISTNAGIRDYRGPNGIWTEAAAAGKVVGEPGEKPGETPWDEAMYRCIPAATPTLAHRLMTLMATQQPPLVQHIISQNEDGLHLRSGLPAAQLSELHGNAFIELCGRYSPGDSDSDLGTSSGSDSDSSDEAEADTGSDSSSGSGSGSGSSSASASSAAKRAAEERRLRPAGCSAAVARDFVTYYGDTYTLGNAAGRHVTRRACPHCRGGAGSAAPVAHSGPLEGPGWLLDSTVDFGEMPGGHPWGPNPVHNVAAAKRHMQLADLVVVWGSSLGVLANYFDPWHPKSKWASPPPRGLRLAPPTAADGPHQGGAKRPRGKGKEPCVAPRPAPCRLVIINKGKAMDEEYAALKIEADVDEVAAALQRALGLPSPAEYRADRDPLQARAVPERQGEPAAPWRFGCAQ